MKLRAGLVCLSRGVLAGIAVLLLTVTPAWSAVRPSATIRKPSLASGISGSSITIDARLSRAVRRVRVYIDHLEVTPRLHRSGREIGGRVDGLQPGLHTLLVTVSSGRRFQSTTWRRFVIGHPSQGLVGFSAPRGVMSAHPVHVTLHLDPGARMLAALNGTEVAGAFDANGRLRTAALSPTHGLHHGRNLLRVLMFRGGSFQQINRRITVRHDHPLAAAGRDVDKVVGARIKLDAGRSIPLDRRDKLAYHWRLIAAPRGSHTSITGAHRRRAALIIDRVGHYRVRLVVTERRRNRRAHIAAAVSSTPDDLDVSSDGFVPAIGVPITTIYHEPQPHSLGITGIKLGAPFHRFYPNPSNETELLVLTRQPLEQQNSTVLYDTTSSTDAANLVAAINAVPAGDMVIITNPGVNFPFVNSAEATQFNQALASIGANPFTSQQLAAAVPVSIIGIKGIPVGQAYENTYLSLGTGNYKDLARPGSLVGYLAKDAQNNFAFTWKDYLPFSTSAANGAISVTINGQTQSVSATSANGLGAFVYDCESLIPLEHPMFIPVGTGSISQEQTNQTALLNYIQNAIGQGNCMVVLQSIGSIHPTSPAWAALASEIGSLGGTPAVFNTVNGAYTLVGGTKLTDPAAEESTALTATGHGTLQGILKRNRQSAFEANLADAFGAFDYSLAEIAYEPRRNWPEHGNAAETAGIKYIGYKWQQNGNLDYKDVRLNYTQDSTVDWGLYSADVHNFKCPASTNVVPNYTQAGCDWAKTELGNEFKWVNNISRSGGDGDSEGLIAHLQSPFQISSEYNYANLQNVAQTIETDLAASNGSGSAGAVFDVMSGLFDGISYTVAEEVEPIFGLIGAAASVAEPFANDGSGTAALQRVQTTATQLGVEVANDYTTETAALARLGAVLVSDYGKLSQAGRNATGDKNWKWVWPTTTQSMATALTESANQFFYGALMPAAYDAWQLPVKDYSGAPTKWTPNAQNFTCDIPNGAITPFGHTPSDGTGQFVAVTGFTSSMTPVTTTYVWGNPSSTSSSYKTPSDSVTSSLFSPASGNGVGLFKPWFWARNFSPKIFVDASDGCS